jgi:HipA-like protein
MSLAAEIQISKEGGTIYSYMGEPKHIYAVQHVRRMRGGSQAHLLRVSDHHFYICKFQNNPQDIRILVNEYLATRLAALLGLPVPEVAIIDVPEWLIQSSPELKIDLGGGLLRPCASGPQFGSRYVVDPQTKAVFDYLPESMLKRIANIHDFLRVLAFDKWTGNADGRQAVFTKEPNQRDYKVWFIDQGYCFNAGEWNFPDSPLRGVFARNAVYEHVTSWDAFEPTLSRIEAITEDIISGIASKIPSDWFRHDFNAISRLIITLYQRRLAARDLITAFRNSSRDPFSNWTTDRNRPANPKTNPRRNK